MARDESPLTLAGRTIGVGLCAPALLAPTLRDGGIAPLAVAALVAVVVGVPAAQAEWRSVPSDRPGLRATVTGTAHVAGLLLVAVAVAPAVRAAGVAGWVLVPLGWAGALVLADRARLVWQLALGLLVLAAARAGFAVMSAPVATLLAPQWSAWPLWLGPAVAGGIVAAGAGTGQWIAGPRRLPGHDATPWAVAGAAVLLGTALALQTGARFEATMGSTTDDLGRDALVAVAALLGAAAVVGRPDDGSARARPIRAALGTLATWWLAGPAAGGVPLVTHGVIPALAASLLLLGVWTSRGTPGRRPVPLLAAAAGALVAVGLSGPSFPAGLGAGVAAGTLLAAAFWVVATRVVLALREAP